MGIKCAAHYNGDVYNFEISDTSSLLEELRAHKIPIPFSCGGEGICTTCRIVVLNGDVTKRTDVEAERAIERGYSEEERLSCQCNAVSKSIEIKVP